MTFQLACIFIYSCALTIDLAPFLHNIMFTDSFDDTAYSSGSQPDAHLVFKDATNTNTIGNSDGNTTENLSGQIPGFTTRRDSHGAAATADGSFVHFVDRIQNVVETFDVKTDSRNTYSLTESGACSARAVADYNVTYNNDPAPDLMDITPDGKYFAIAFRGPAPVTVGHGAQGSCPGVGIVEISDDGSSGRLVDVLRTTNTVSDLNPSKMPDGGLFYYGDERSDVLGTIVVYK